MSEVLRKATESLELRVSYLQAGTMCGQSQRETGLMRIRANTKYIALTGTLATAIALGSAVSGAAEQSGREGQRPSFETLDTNGDGQVVRSELESHMKTRFDRRDTNDDGVLSRAELEAHMQSDAAARLDRMLARVDSNSDGVVSFEEMSAARSGRLFERADANEDGVITKSEFDQMRSQAKAKRSQSQQ